MKDRLQKRLKELRAEYETATKVLADLEVREKDAKIAILTLRGAIGVIEDELKKDGDYEEVKKPAPKREKPQPVQKPDSPMITAKDSNPEWYDKSQTESTLPAAPGPDRNSEVLRQLRKHAPPDRKYSPDSLDELFAGTYSRSEIDETLGVLELDGMIVRIRTGIKVM
jgi:hypothetical protein